MADYWAVVLDPFPVTNSKSCPLTKILLFDCPCFTGLLYLLAPTGALYVMMVCFISAAAIFSDFHSVHWCNWCYKYHFRSLKQYQCDWYHKMLINADWMLNVQMSKYSNVQVFKWPNVQMVKCSNVQIFKSSNIQIFNYSNVQIFKCSNVKCQMSDVRCQISNVKCQ